MDSSTSVRPTRHRLLTAMGVSVCAIATLLALLESLVDFAVSVSKPGIELGDPLTVYIRNGEGEKNFDSSTDNEAVRALPQEQVVSTEFAEIRQDVATVISPQPRADSAPMELQPVKDWRAIADEAAKATVDENFAQEESRVSMWRRSHSIMFQPVNDIVVKDKEPILSNFRFKPRVYVVGLGVTIGSCFIGIPIVGVPVEQRNVAMTLFVCAQDSG